MTLKVTKEQALEAKVRIDQEQGDAARARQVCACELRAIEPYTCRSLSRVKAIIGLIADASPERQPVLLAKLAEFSTREAV
jgi:hypothetical protein